MSQLTTNNIVHLHMLVITLTFERNSNVGIVLAQNYFVKLLLKKMHKERRRERERKGGRKKEKVTRSQVMR
jgi:hypothetical protein